MDWQASIRGIKPAEFLRRYIWFGVDAIVIFCLIKSYEYVRNSQGSNAYPPEAALHNAELVISFEKTFGFYWEESIQQTFLPHEAFIRFWNNYYASVHGLTTFSTLLISAILNPDVYHRVKLPFILMNVFALLGYASFPLMPPRLLNDCETPFGGCDDQYKFQDTMYTIGGMWSYRTETVSNHSNHYAAMPSMHMGWSSWVAWTFWSVTGWPIFFLYPCMTFFCVVVTANHYILDGLVGITLLLLSKRICDAALEKWRVYKKLKAQGYQAVEMQEMPV